MHNDALLADLRIERRRLEARRAVLARQIRDANGEIETIDERLRDIDHAEGWLT